MPPNEENIATPWVSLQDKPLLSPPEVDARDISSDERTILNPKEEEKFQIWALKNGVPNPDDPNHFYDYRGAYIADEGPDKNGHWTDKYKQHGHETFSQESQYSNGPGDGGTWIKNKKGEDIFVPAQNIGETVLQSPRNEFQLQQPGQQRPDLGLPSTALIPPTSNQQFDLDRPNVRPPLAPLTKIEQKAQQAKNEALAKVLEAEKKAKAEADARTYGPLPTNQYLRNFIDRTNQSKEIEKAGGEISERGLQTEANIYGTGGAFEKDQVEQQLERNKQQAINTQKSLQDVTLRNKELSSKIEEQMRIGVDPSRWWNSKSTEGKILSGLGMAMAGFSAGLLHQDPSKSPAVQMIQKAIEDDINAQKSNIDNSWKGIQKLHEISNDQYNQELHANTFKNWSMVSGLKVVELQIKQAQAGTQSEQVKIALAKTLQGIDQKKDDVLNKIWVDAQNAAANAAEKQRKEMREAEKEIGAQVAGLIKDGTVSSVEDAIKIVKGVSPGLFQRAGSLVPTQVAEQRGMSKIGLDQEQEVYARHFREGIDRGLTPDQAHKNAMDNVNNLNTPEVQALRKSRKDATSPFPTLHGKPDDTILIVRDDNGSPVPKVGPDGKPLPGTFQTQSFPNKEERDSADKAQTQRIELNHSVGELSRFKDPFVLKAISPTLIQGAIKDENGKDIYTVGQREVLQHEYKSFVLRAVAEMYKAQTGGVEPKNMTIIEELAAPYLPPTGAFASETWLTTQRRLDTLEHDLKLAMSTKARAAPSQTPGAVQSPSNEIPSWATPRK